MDSRGKKRPAGTGSAQRFLQRRGKRPVRLLEHKRYRAAWDFLELRCLVGDAEEGLAEWWSDFAAAQGADREQLQQQVPAEGQPRSGRRRRRRGRGSRGAPSAT